MSRRAVADLLQCLLGRSSDRLVGRPAWATQSSYMFVADVDGFVDDDPRDRFLATGLRQRAVIRDVIISRWQQTVDWQVSNVYAIAYANNKTGTCALAV